MFAPGLLWCKPLPWFRPTSSRLTSLREQPWLMQLAARKPCVSNSTTFVGLCHDARDNNSPTPLSARRSVGMRSRCPGDGVVEESETRESSKG